MEWPGWGIVPLPPFPCPMICGLVHLFGHNAVRKDFLRRASFLLPLAFTMRIRNVFPITLFKRDVTTFLL